MPGKVSLLLEPSRQGVYRADIQVALKMFWSEHTYTPWSRFSAALPQITQVPGGVGRNIAEALSRLLPGTHLPPPLFLSLVGEDAAGDFLLARLRPLRYHPQDHDSDQAKYNHVHAARKNADVNRIFAG